MQNNEKLPGFSGDILADYQVDFVAFQSPIWNLHNEERIDGVHHPSAAATAAAIFRQLRSGIFKVILLREAYLSLVANGHI
ncbi:unnamed protein product [Anisakis simplex]|uniref:SGNH domain-containing protein n=1 Tax=Anisakis simplex TaxID=6269 RepID=A0A0M3JYF6_ANISI|nr:unnamed protein product [Anisakis simplex]